MVSAGVALLANAPVHLPEKTKRKKDEVSKRADGVDNIRCITVARITEQRHREFVLHMPQAPAIMRLRKSGVVLQLLMSMTSR